MIEKVIPAFEHGGATSFMSSEGINKVASLQTHIPEKLAHVIKESERNPDPKYAYLYDRALGAGEVYGCNNNGDWFGREDLIKNHDTFVKHAKLYRHHQNKDPNNSVGDVMASAYNEPLDTGDLIIRAPIEKIASELHAFENEQKLIQTSMGAKVPYDVCNYCDHKARKRSEYCSHLRFQMKKLMPNGRQVYAKNPNPTFMDISLVIIRAAPESVVLRKIAHMFPMAAMLKEDVGSNISNDSRGAINPHLIEAPNHLPRVDALMTLHEAKGTLRPDEFQAVLRTDASLIRTDIVPHVRFRMIKSASNRIHGHALPALVSAFEHVPNIKCASKNVYADFLTADEMSDYLYYRNVIGPFREDFLR